MTVDRTINRRIFVVGVPRSGTTLVQSLLAAHSDMTSFTESHLFDRHFTLMPIGAGVALTKNPARRLREFVAENEEPLSEGLDRLEVGGRWPLGLRIFLPLRTREVFTRIVGVLDELALRRERSGWIEKTPRHLRYTPWIQSICARPRPIVVHVVREGLEVVASLREASESWERAYDLEACVRRWNADVGFSLRRATAPNNHVVFYEELTSEPRLTLTRLFDELGLEWQPEILERYANASEHLITGEESWKADIGRGIRPSANARRRLTAEERDWADRRLRQDLYQQLSEAAR
jgi:hypothetical protein